MECELCGGTNFIKEFGYFYCTECQTQSQEIKEHVFEDEFVNIKSAKKVKAKEEIKHNKFTTWECYNVVIFSLTRQLIDLGANEKLKRVVKCLWLRYLEKLEVLDVDFDAVPRLQLVNCKRDAHIISGRKKKKRKRKCSSSSEDYSTNASGKSECSRRQITKKKTALVKRHYEEVSIQATQDSTSLHNETLSSLKGDSEKSLAPGDNLRYNKFSVREMKKTMSKYHCEKHKKYNEDLKCHQSLKFSKDYKYGVHFLSPIKVYSLLYLGLLIVKDSIQLGDLLRFIREGHLYFNKYTHLFPDEYDDHFLNIINNNKNKMFSSTSVRECTAKIAKFLGVTSFIVCPDLTEMCQRYCNELNLPQVFSRAVENIVSKTLPKFPVKNSFVIPNYEGRVMSVLVFVFKLLFGLDGVTEFHFSNYADVVNDIFNTNMFDIISWTQYIAYRKLVMQNYHFPSFHSHKKYINSDLLLEYASSQSIPLDSVSNLTREMKDFVDVLTKIKSFEYNDEPKFLFPASLTPFKEYFKIIYRGGNIQRTNAERNFETSDIEFLLTPNSYLNALGYNVHVKNGGANDNWIMNELKTFRNINNINRKEHNLIVMEVTNSGDDNFATIKKNQVKRPNSPVAVQEYYQKGRQHIFKKNSNFLEKLCSDIHVDRVESVHSYKIHYNPYERYWLNVMTNIDLISKRDFENYFDDHSSTFKIIFEEFSRVIEQSNTELYKEFQMTELFLTYSKALLKKDSFRSKKLLDNQLNYYIQQAEKQW